MRYLGLLVALVALASCSDSYEQQQQALENYINKKQLGSSKDYWLTKKNMFGDWEKTALIFGYLDDYDVCTDLAAMYMMKYPADIYDCVPAN